MTTASSFSYTQYTWNKLKRNTLSLFGLVVILFFILVAIAGPLIRPDVSPWANEQILELSIKPPGFTIDLIKIAKNQKESNESWLSTFLSGKKNQYRLVSVYDLQITPQYVYVEEYTGSKLNSGLIHQYQLPDVVYAVNSNKEITFKEGQYHFTTIEDEEVSISSDELREKILSEHIVHKTFFMGTDRFGRDMLSRLMAGTRISLSVGFISVVISIILGLFLGAIAGYFGGKVDDAIVWLINVAWSIPTLLLVIVITLTIGRGFWQVFVAVGLTMWVDLARVVRGQVISLKENEYIDAGYALGFKHSRIIFRHILPNVMGVVIVIATANFATSILIEAGLSFLGIGAQPPMTSWGSIIRDHYGYIIVDAAYLAVFPSIAIMVLVLSFILLGNGLRDAFDVKGISGT